MPKKMSKAETHFFVAFMLIMAAGIAVIAGGIIYGIATHFQQSLIFLGGVAVFAGIVHLIARRLDLDGPT